MREPVAADIRTIFNADSMALAEERLRVLIQKYAKTKPAPKTIISTALWQDYAVA